MAEVAYPMRRLVLILLLLPIALLAQDEERFANAVQRKAPQAMDRWMRHELRAHRKGTRITNPVSSYVVHQPTYDSLVAWLRRQPGVQDAQWDKCVMKTLGWPGVSTIGLHVYTEHLVAERCYSVQEGRPGTIDLFGWRPHVRKSREQLKFLRVSDCPGFVEEQRKLCAGQIP